MSRIANKLWFSAITIAALVAVICGLWVMKFGHRTGGVFPLRKLVLQSEFQHQSAEQIRAAILPQLRAGFFGVDLRQTRDVLAAMPWTASVEVRKRWPDLVMVQLHERKAVASWGEDKLVDSTGALFAVASVEQMSALPKLAAPESRRIELLDFVASTQKPLAAVGLRLVQARLSERGGLSVGLSNGVQVIVGRQQFNERWARLMESLPTLLAKADSMRLVDVDLRYTNGMAVRFEPVQAAPGSETTPGPAAPRPRPDSGAAPAPSSATTTAIIAGATPTGFQP
jgi:cell division protein FtsQ